MEWECSVVVVALPGVTVWLCWVCVIEPVPELSSVVLEFVENVFLDDSVESELDDEVRPEEPVVVVVRFVVVVFAMEFEEVG